MLTEKFIWGAIPAGFNKIADGQGRCLVVRQDQEDKITIPICVQSSGGNEESGFHGRAQLRSFKLPNGEIALIRRYRHGGVFRKITGGVFFTWPPRPFRELILTEEVRRRGVPTVEVYGACVERVIGPSYRGWLVTRELSEAYDLWAALRGGFAQEVGMAPLLRAVADSLRAMHREGVYHGDLNLKNILVRAESNGARGYIIDLDKAKLFLGGLPAELGKRNLARLLRSVRKLDPERKYFTVDCWTEFLGYYHGADERAV